MSSPAHGASLPWRIASSTLISEQTPDAASMWPRFAFVPIAQKPRAGDERRTAFASALQLDRVAELGAGAVALDVAEVLDRHAGVAQRARRRLFDHLQVFGTYRPAPVPEWPIADARTTPWIAVRRRRPPGAAASARRRRRLRLAPGRWRRRRTCARGRPATAPSCRRAAGTCSGAGSGSRRRRARRRSRRRGSPGAPGAARSATTSTRSTPSGSGPGSRAGTRCGSRTRSSPSRGRATRRAAAAISRT